MTEETKYKPGDFYRICDQTGFKIRASRTRKQWNNLIVRKESWEARNPQDFVRGVPDYMIVPEARPRPGTQYIANTVLLTDSPNNNYGPPLHVDAPTPTGEGGYIYTGGTIGPNEVPIVDPSKYPRSW